MGRHSWKCISSGMYDDLMECCNCGQKYVTQADSIERRSPPGEGCEVYRQEEETCAALNLRSAALEAEVAKLKVVS